MGRESSVPRGGRALEWKVSTRREESWVSNKLFRSFPLPSCVAFLSQGAGLSLFLSHSLGCVLSSPLYRCVGPGGSCSRPHPFSFLLSRLSRYLLFLSFSYYLRRTHHRNPSPNLVYLPTVDLRSFRSNPTTFFFFRTNQLLLARSRIFSC